MFRKTRSTSRNGNKTIRELFYVNLFVRPKVLFFGTDSRTMVDCFLLFAQSNFMLTMIFRILNRKISRRFILRKNLVVFSCLCFFVAFRLVFSSRHKKKTELALWSPKRKIHKETPSYTVLGSNWKRDCFVCQKFYHVLRHIFLHLQIAFKNFFVEIAVQMCNKLTRLSRTKNCTELTSHLQPHINRISARIFMRAANKRGLFFRQGPKKKLKSEASDPYKMLCTRHAFERFWTYRMWW